MCTYVQYKLVLDGAFPKYGCYKNSTTDTPLQNLSGDTLNGTQPNSRRSDLHH